MENLVAATIGRLDSSRLRRVVIGDSGGGEGEAAVVKRNLTL